MNRLTTRPPQDGLTVLDFQISCRRPGTLALYPRSSPIVKVMDKNWDFRDDFEDAIEGFKVFESKIRDVEDVEVLRSAA